MHVPEFIEHDHHTKVITIHHHHHKPKKEHHDHHHKPIIPYGPPKYHFNHHHSKSSSHSVTKGHHTTLLGKKSRGKHGHHGHQGKHGHSGLDSGHKVDGHTHHESPSSYDPPSYDPPSYDKPIVNYAPPSVNYNSGSSYGSDYGPFLPSVPSIPSPQVHGIEHTVQQIKLYNTVPGGLKTGGYEVVEQGDGGEDVFTSVNSLSQSYPGAYGYGNHAAAEQSDPFSDIAQSNTNQAPNANPFLNAQPQPIYTSLENFKVQSQPAEPILNVQQPYYEPYPQGTEYENGDNDNLVIGHDVSGPSALSYDDAAQDDTPVSFSREAGTQHAINTGGIETVAY